MTKKIRHNLAQSCPYCTAGPHYSCGHVQAAAPQQEAQEPIGWTTGITWRPNPRLQSEQVIKITRDAQPNYGYTTPIYTAPQQEAQEPAARYTIEDVRKARSEGYRNGVESSVPSKITKEMRHAFREKYKEGSIWTDRLDIALEGMLAAAPQPTPVCHHRPPCDECAAIAAQGDTP